jgi:hypothetical protein
LQPCAAQTQCLSNDKEPAFPLSRMGKLALHFLCPAHLLSTIFSCTTSTRISFLHLGQ